MISPAGNMSLIGLTLALLIVVLCTSQGKIIALRAGRAPLANGSTAEFCERLFSGWQLFSSGVPGDQQSSLPVSAHRCTAPKQSGMLPLFSGYLFMKPQL